MKPAIDELGSLESSKVVILTKALANLAMAELKNDPIAIERAQNELADMLAEAQAMADMLGRRRLIIEAEKAAGRKLYNLMPVPFVEAIESVIQRIPALANTYEQVRELYRQGAFALVRSSSMAITKHVQSVITAAAMDGVTREVAVNEIVEALGSNRWDRPGAAYLRSYSDTVFRTATATAYSEGRIKQAEDPAVRRVIGAWRYDATLDGDVRPNHRAADGFIAALDDPIWDRLKPPMGYNCRCALALVPRSVAYRAGVISEDGVILYQQAPVGAFRDPGF